MIRQLLLALSLLIAGLNCAHAEPRIPTPKSTAQEMMDQAEKALEVEEEVTPASKPIVVPGKKSASPPPTKPGPMVQGAGNGGASNDSSSAPVKIVPGSGTSKTSLAPAQYGRGEPHQSVIAGDGGADRQPQVSTRTPVSSTGLPGLGTPVGVAGMAPVKPIPLQVQNGVNEFVPVSTRFPNRIQTPFFAPKVVDFSLTQFDTVGGDVYIVPKGAGPIGIYIREDNRPDSPVIALTLLPKDIPGQTIIANIDGGYRASRSGSKGNEEAAVSSYEELLRKIMRRVVLEKAPSGYTESPLEIGSATIGPLRVVPERQYSGSTFDIYRYRIRNTAKESFELSEESFYQAGVKAVAFFPLLRLEPGQTTKVFIVTGKAGVDDDR